MTVKEELSRGRRIPAREGVARMRTSYGLARLAGMARGAGALAHVWWIVTSIWLQRAALDLAPGGRPPGPSFLAQIRGEVLRWPGVTEHPHRFGGVEFRLGRIELGHLHGDYLADLPFPVRVRRELVAAGRAMPHHILPTSGWVSYPIRDAAAVPGAIELFRLAYDRAAARKRDG